jgi:hypothetical protein
MISEKLKTLIEKLKIKTESRQALWKKTSRDTEFKLEFQKGAVTIDNWTDDIGTFVDLRIINENGDEVEEVVFNSNSFEQYIILQELSELVKKSYYKTDETFKTLLDELDSDKIVGKGKDDLPF